MRIWRDIPTQRVISEAMSPAALSARATWNLLAVVARYHSFQKDQFDNLLIRETTLEEVAVAAETALGSVEPGRMAYQRYFRRLARRARAKASYLNLLRAYYGSNAEELLDPEKLWRDMIQPREIRGKALGIQPGARLEKADPAHRDFEMMIREDDVAPDTAVASRAAMDWYRALKNGLTTAPLWLHLETTDFCLNPAEAKRIDVVPYLDQQSREQVFAIKPSLDRSYLCQARLDQGGYNWAKFDTQWVTPRLTNKGGGKKSLAFVWGVDKELFADLHNPTKRAERDWGRFHHSSFTGGDMVLCAGMIAAKDGLVTYINNNSGHYRPGRPQLLKLVKYLNKRGFFDANAIIDDFTVEPAAPCSVAQYIAAA